MHIPPVNDLPAPINQINPTIEPILIHQGPSTSLIDTAPQDDNRRQGRPKKAPITKEKIVNADDEPGSSEKALTGQPLARRSGRRA